jgi:hydrogenase-4 transcriptional activator
MAAPGRRSRQRPGGRSARAPAPAHDAAPPPALADRDGLDDRVIGAEGGLRQVMERVAQVARSTAPVLILGETGSGKEVVARAIHAQSARDRGPFIRVNCGALPTELIDSELFGHERGSFTGAMATRRGWFEQAHGGTLLLDEIGELSLAAQVRLLRVLQDGVLQRVGGEKPLTVDVRVVAATHRDLADMVRRGRFRHDLWYRLAVFPIALPSLREHPEDIPAMAEHFTRRAAARFGVPYRAPGERDIALLVAYPWPGNVRELAAVMDRAVLLGEGARLEVARALGAPSPHSPPSPLSPAPAGPAAAPRPDEIEPLDAVMRRHIERALAATHGRVDGPFGAARLLHINPHTLRARMRKLGVDWRRHRES